MPGPVDTDALPPERLSETGLYAAGADGPTAPEARGFEPAYVLWSDGAKKRRWVVLPACTRIDALDMEDWQVPVGTKLFKEFSVDGKRIETRMTHRYGAGPDDFTYATYVWNEEETEAFLTMGGVEDARGTSYDVPASWNCKTCHDHAPSRVLGFSAIQLAHDGPGLTLSDLLSEDLLSEPPAVWPSVPGDATTRAALGYLHANCGHCHNRTPEAVSFYVKFDLRVAHDAAFLEDAGAYQTAVGVKTTSFTQPGVTHRIAPGDPEASCVPVRMSARGTKSQMPPLATELVDDAGLAAVEAWILSLQP